MLTRHSCKPDQLNLYSKNFALRAIVLILAASKLIGPTGCPVWQKMWNDHSARHLREHSSQPWMIIAAYNYKTPEHSQCAAKNIAEH